MKIFSYHLTKVLRPTNDICLLTALPVDKSHRLHFTAGQYVEAKLIDGRWLPLSIANAPHENGMLEFHIRHNQTHLLASTWLEEVLNSKTLELLGPKGKSTLPDLPLSSTLILLAGGTGYAPLRSLLQALFKTPEKVLFPIYLYWGVSHENDAYDAAQLFAWEHTFPFFHFEQVLSNAHPSSNWSGKIGWVHAHCSEQHDDFSSRLVFASGPFEMIKAAYAEFTAKGLLPKNFISDMLDN